jgi:hypothetical protein
LPAAAGWAAHEVEPGGRGTHLLGRSVRLAEQEAQQLEGLAGQLDQLDAVLVALQAHGGVSHRTQCKTPSLRPRPLQGCAKGTNVDIALNS